MTTVMALALLTFLIWLLVQWKPKTPFVFITATKYDIPVPINAWASEDREALAALNRKNISVPEHLPDWNESDGKFDLLPKSVDLSVYRKVAPLVVYLSVHGVVKADGEPCVLPPGVSINDPTHWVPVAKLLDEIVKKVPEPRNTLLVLDCNRIRVNWNLGIVYNTFTERVRELVERKQIPRLAVLTSAGPGQVNWTSADFGGSVFARYLQLGLAGAADAEGDNDDDVTLQELASYLRHEVNDWSQFNRGEKQEPTLIPKDAKFHVTYAIDSGGQAALAEQLKMPKSPGSHESDDKDHEMWSKFDELRKAGLVRCDPIACRDFEHQLLRLDEMSEGGEEYAEDAKRLRAEVAGKLSKAVDRVHAIPTGSHSAASFFGMMTEAAWLRSSGAAFSLPACEYFGSCDAKQAEQVREAWKRLIDTRTPETADKIVDGSGVAKVIQNLAETQFLAAVRQQQVASLWPNIKFDEVLDRRVAAENAAVPREGSGKPGDERAHYYARYAADKADASRRLAEDLLFVGQQNAPKQFGKLAQEADELGAWTNQVMKDASTAFRVRDEVFAEGPYLAEWLCDPLSSATPDRDKLVPAKLIPLFHEAHDLSKTINRVEKLRKSDYLAQAASLPFRSQSERVQGGLDAIQAEFDKEVVALTKHDSGEIEELQQLDTELREPKIAEPTREALLKKRVELAAAISQVWRQLDAALRAPLIPGSTREALLNKRAKLASALHAEFMEKEGERKDKGKEKEAGPLHGEHESAPIYLESAHQWNVHPLFEILQVTAPRVEQPLNWSDKAGAQARQVLEERTSERSEKDASADKVEVDKIASERQRLSQAEAEARAKAALTNQRAEAKTEEVDPIGELRRFDVQQLLIWNGQRAIADFWQSTVKTDSPSPFFERAATGYFQAATNLNEPMIAAVADQIDQAKRLIPAKKERLSIAAKAQVPPEDEKAAVISLEVGAELNTTRDPSGFASLYLRDDLHRLGDLVLRPESPARVPYIDMSAIGGKPQRFGIRIAKTAGYSSALEAVAFFRGRANAIEFGLPVINGVRIEYFPHVYKDQSITLVGDRRQRSSIEFILDCSHSMDEPTTVKKEAKKEKAERLKLAKNHLKTMLDELVARNQQLEEIRVGMRFFGHRVARVLGADNVPTGAILLQEEYLQKLAELLNKPELAGQAERARLRELGPSRDIEEARPIGRFDDTINEDLKHRIDLLKPWGETPLYLALKEALAGFETEPADSRKYIIAITDGKNETTDSTTIDDVIEASKKARVPIYILGFAISDKEIQEATAAYKKLAEDTGGEFYNVSTGNELLSALRARLAADLYKVPESGHSPVKLSESVPIASEQLPNDYSVTFRSIPPKPVHLEGGEAIELYMSDDSQDIVAKPYKTAIEQATLLGTSQKPFVLRVHRPLRNKAKDSVVFPISIQVDPKAYHFTGRPLETWVEISPLTENVSAGQPYVFYDTNFEPHEPVPVLKWTALNWPKDANRARIRFWCKSKTTAATQTIALRDLMNKPQSVAGVELSANVSSEGERCMVRVEERHGSQSPGIDDLRVSFDTDLHYKPLRVIHVFDAKRGVATHSYYFPSELQENIERPAMATVVLTRGNDIKDGALQLPTDGLVVPISAAGEVFSPNATINGR